MAEKQPSHLNGAYYGPSIPPPRQSYYRPERRSRGCGCCGCLFFFLLKLIVTFVVVVGLASFIFWLVFRPNRIRFQMTDASLTQFNYTNNTLHYNLNLNITIRNPNKKIGIYYDSIEARAYYDDYRFHAETLTPFYQGHKNTTVLSPVFKGQQLVFLGANEVSDFNSEKSVGVYDIEVKLYLRLRFKVSKIKTWRIKPKIKCDLKLPLSSNANSATGFQTTKCGIDF